MDNETEQITLYANLSDLTNSDNQLTYNDSESSESETERTTSCLKSDNQLTVINDESLDSDSSDWDEDSSSIYSTSDSLIPERIANNNNDYLKICFDDSNYQLSLKITSLYNHKLIESLFDHIENLKKIQTKHMKLANKNLKLQNEELIYKYQAINQS